MPCSSCPLQAEDLGRPEGTQLRTNHSLGTQSRSRNGNISEKEGQVVPRVWKLGSLGKGCMPPELLGRNYTSFRLLTPGRFPSTLLPSHHQQRRASSQNTFEWQNNLCLIRVLDLKLEV